MNPQTFGTAINCIDGRTQKPVIDFVKKKFNVDYVDMITEPGPVKIISEYTDIAAVQSIKRRLEISNVKHQSKGVAVVGHHDCAGNPVEILVQLRQIADSTKIVQSWGYNIKIIGLWIDEYWIAHQI